MQNKRGQFYLIATIIIIVAIMGIGVTSNYAKKKNPVKLYDLREELGIESSNVLSFGVYREEDLDMLLENFIQDYVDYAGEGRDLYFIFGDEAEITAAAYQDLSSEEVRIKIGTNEPTTLTSGEPQVFLTSGPKVAIIVGEEEYSFNLRTGENFYFVIMQEIEGEKYVITS